MKYNWNIASVEVYKSLESVADVVYKVNYEVSVFNGSFGVSLEKEQDLDVSSTTEFIPIEELNSETVIEWVKSNLGEDGVRVVEEEVDELLNRKTNTYTKVFNN